MSRAESPILKFLVIIVAILSMAACAPILEPEKECNFVQNSQLQRVSWNASLPIKIYLHSSVPEEFIGAISQAMKSWDASLGSRPIFELAGIITQGSEPVQDGSSVIYWREDWDDVRTSEQARTTIFWKGSQIQEADIQVNARDFNFFWGDQAVSGAVDVESLMLHELGHVLGLGHNEASLSVMASRLASATLRRDPSKADVDSLRCEY